MTRLTKFCNFVRRAFLGFPVRRAAADCFAAAAKVARCLQMIRLQMIRLLILPPRLRAVRSSHDEGMHTPLPECRFSVKYICTRVLKLLITRVFVFRARNETIGSKFEEAKITVVLWPPINVSSAGGMMES